MGRTGSSNPRSDDEKNGDDVGKRPPCAAVRNSRIPLPSFVPFPSAPSVSSSAVSPPGATVRGREGAGGVGEKAGDDGADSTRRDHEGRRREKGVASGGCGGDGDGTLPAPSMVRLPLSEGQMTKLESALQLLLQRHKQQQQQSHPRAGVVSYSDFCQCASRLVLDAADDDDDGVEETTTGTGIRSGPPAGAPPVGYPLLDLSWEERLWHDLYCVAVPTLYRCSDDDIDEWGVVGRPRTTGELRSAPLPATGGGSYNGRSSNNNRWRELRRLVRNARARGVPASRSLRAVAILRSLRRPTPRGGGENDAAATTTTTEAAAPCPPATQRRTAASVDVDSLLGMPSSSASRPRGPPGATLEDRIRARALERERDAGEALAARRDPREDRVAVADALYSHAHRILRRLPPIRRGGTGGGSAAPAVPDTQCVLTFGDVRQVLRQWPRREIAALLLDVARIVPGWIRWTDPQRGENGVPISKDATVWIETNGYKRARAVLNGERPPPVTKAAAPDEGQSMQAAAPVSSELTPVAPRTVAASRAPLVTVSTKKIPPAPPLGREKVISSPPNVGKKRPAAGGQEPVPSRSVKSLKSLTAAVERFGQTVAEARNGRGGASPLPAAGKKRPSSGTANGRPDDPSDRPGKVGKTAPSHPQRRRHLAL